MNNLRKYGIFIIILLLLVGYYQLFVIPQAKKDVTQGMKVLLTDSIQYYKNKQGELIGQNKAIIADRNSIKETLELAGVETKKLKKEVGNLKNLVTYYKGKATATDTIRTSTVDTVFMAGMDTVRAKKFNYSNGFLKISNGLFFNDQVEIPYTYSLEFEQKTYWKRGFLKSPVLVTDLKFKDPNLIPIDQTLIYNKPKKRFYEKTWFQFGVGFLTGAYVKSKL